MKLVKNVIIVTNKAFGICFGEKSEEIGPFLVKTTEYLPILVCFSNGDLNIVGIRLSAIQLPETSSYWTFISPLTEW